MPVLRLLSDLHFEFEEPAESQAFIDTLDFAPREICVLAGDIVSQDLHRIIPLLESWPATPFFFVPGNHEFFMNCISDVHKFFRDLQNKHPNFIYGARRGGPARLVGATLFYPPPLDEQGLRDLTWWVDWRATRNPIDIFYEAGFDRGFLGQSLDASRIAVTHMLPRQCCVTPQWEGNPNNRFFVNETVWNDLTEERRPKLWLFGHTHDSVDVEKDGTRFVCNPRGYPQQRNPDFDPFFRIEVP